MVKMAEKGGKIWKVSCLFLVLAGIAFIGLKIGWKVETKEPLLTQGGLLNAARLFEKGKKYDRIMEAGFHSRYSFLPFFKKVAAWPFSLDEKEEAYLGKYTAAVFILKKQIEKNGFICLGADETVENLSDEEGLALDLMLEKQNGQVLASLEQKEGELSEEEVFLIFSDSVRTGFNCRLKEKTQKEEEPGFSFIP